MDIDGYLDNSAPRSLQMTASIERELGVLAAVHATAARQKKTRFMSRFRNHRAALFGAIGLVVVGGASAATAAPAVVEFFEQLVVDRSSIHDFSASAESSCAIDWTIAPAEGSGADNDDPALLAAREYLLSLDLSTITPQPVYLEAARNTDGMEGPARSEQETISMALMSTVNDLVRAEVKGQGFDEYRISLHASSYAPMTTNACE